SSPRRREPNLSATSTAASTCPSRKSQGISGSSDVEADLEHVAVLDLVVLALDAQATRVLGGVPRAELEQLVPSDDLGTDEASLQVGVDDTGALGRLGSGAEGPGPALLVAGR